MRNLMIPMVALALSACGSQPQAQEPTPQVPAMEQRQINFKEGSPKPVEVVVFKDTTGCEWLIFRYRGYNVSTEPRMIHDPAGGSESVQLCRTVEPK